jgi:rsbT co-antagonist protein RsbR
MLPPMSKAASLAVDVLQQDPAGLLAEWQSELKARGAGADHRVRDSELREQGAELLRLIAAAIGTGTDIASEPWRPVREFLEGVSRARALQGFNASETATYIFSLKRPLFARVRARAKDPETLGDATWAITELADKLGMHTVAAFQSSREAVISRQQEELLELSTPVVKLWEGVVALPMIGTLDSARTQVVMESLLQRIVDTGSEIAIIDITGVPTVDTLVAQHLLKTVTAIRLMGADCIISGIRPQIAQTIVHLGVELEGVTTKATLADALALAFKRSGLSVTRARA